MIQTKTPDSTGTVLSMAGIRKSFQDVEVLHGIDLALHEGEVLALMGENGAGKSTLMNILAGLFTDWTGSITLDGNEIRIHSPRDAENAGIAMIHQELNLVPELTIAENIFLGREPLRPNRTLDYRMMNRQAAEVMASLNFHESITRPVSSLRVGQQQLVEIGKTLIRKARILLMDEPTSALAEREINTLFTVINGLKSQGVSIIYVSHRLDEVFEIADRIFVLRDGAKTGMGNTGELNQYQLVQLMVGRPVDEFFIHENHLQDEVIMRVRNLTRLHPHSSRKPLLNSVSLELRRGELLGIAGLLGSGRTVLLETLFCREPSLTRGEIEINGEPVIIKHPVDAMKHGLALLTEDRKGTGIIPEMSVSDNLSLAGLMQKTGFGLLLPGEERLAAGEAAGRYNISMRDPGQPVTTLSGGNQQKVLLAKWMALSPDIILLDDPTRGIDVGAKHDIYLLLARLTGEGRSIIMTSSELTELTALADRILVLREGEMTALLEREDICRETILKAAASG